MEALEFYLKDIKFEYIKYEADDLLDIRRKINEFQPNKINFQTF